jgi:hypothetical protein
MERTKKLPETGSFEEFNPVDAYRVLPFIV